MQLIDYVNKYVNLIIMHFCGVEILLVHTCFNNKVSRRFGRFFKYLLQENCNLSCRAMFYDSVK